MQASTAERIGVAQKAVFALVTALALVLLGLVLAYWTWEAFAPRSVALAPAARAADSGVADASGLFGNAATGGPAAAGGTVRLLGVVAASGSGPGYAVLRLDEKQSLAVRVGGEVEPGVRLEEVHADHVVLQRKGVRESLAWPAPAK